MKIDRREFLAGAAFVAVAPALPALPTSSTPTARPVGPIAFMIDGWSMHDDLATIDQVWVSVNRSWRTAWR
jgi:hypothetical protein